ncbi:MAG: hypothetical protein MI861_13260 [Pirellulales bacterium]|nr:hypothetical protein [Pirellulales bacterium]
MQNDTVVIRDIDIPFGRLVSIMLKIMFAAIPAVILFYLFFAVLGLLFAGGAGLLTGILAR